MRMSFFLCLFPAGFGAIQTTCEDGLCVECGGGDYALVITVGIVSCTCIAILYFASWLTSGKPILSVEVVQEVFDSCKFHDVSCKSLTETRAA